MIIWRFCVKIFGQISLLSQEYCMIWLWSRFLDEDADSRTSWFLNLCSLFWARYVTFQNSFTENHQLQKVANSADNTKYIIPISPVLNWQPLVWNCIKILESLLSISYQSVIDQLSISYRSVIDQSSINYWSFMDYLSINHWSIIGDRWIIDDLNFVFIPLVSFWWRIDMNFSDVELNDGVNKTMK